MQSDFAADAKGLYSFSDRLHRLDVHFYDVFEELYLSHYDDFENSRIKCDLLLDDQSELENKLELVLF